MGLRSVLRAIAEAGVDRVAAYNRRRLPRDADPFGAGIHEPMSIETQIDDLAITGAIPPEFDGRYLKMGANPVRPGSAGHHWFLGDGMIHGIALRDGKARWYRNRWIGSKDAAAVLGREPAPGPRRGRSDTVNTNVVAFGHRVFALVEAGSFPVELSLSLNDQRYNPFDGSLHGSFTGHPHRDPSTGEHHAIAYEGGVLNQVNHVVVSDAAQVIRSVPIPVNDGPCIHDCALTRRFVVVLDLPVTFSMRTVLAGHRFPFCWNPKHRARVGLLPRGGEGDEVIWCDVEPCFVFHTANAYDGEAGTVVLDVIAYDTMFSRAGSGLDALGRLERWTIDPMTRRVERRTIDQSPQEFPRIDERRIGRKHRYVYSVSVPPDANPQLEGATCIYKHDLETDTRRVCDFGEGHVPGEFVFVPSSPTAAEDEGWLIGLVIDVKAQTTLLNILDAATFASKAVATVLIPHRIPPGFHGNWFPRGSSPVGTGA